MARRDSNHFGNLRGGHTWRLIIKSGIGFIPLSVWSKQCSKVKIMTCYEKAVKGYNYDHYISNNVYNGINNYSDSQGMNFKVKIRILRFWPKKKLRKILSSTLPLKILSQKRYCSIWRLIMIIKVQQHRRLTTNLLEKYYWINAIGQTRRITVS